jgi:Cu(I)/Ag(I) efflux system membrane fusion protein
MTEIRKGVTAGQQVVVSGQFLIDSESSLKGFETRLGESPAAAATAPMPAVTGEHRAEGRVEKIANNEVMLSHGPVPALKWGPMTMGFVPPAAGWPAAIVVGDRVTFTFRPRGAGEFEIVSISRAITAPAAAPATAPAAAPAAAPKAMSSDPHAAPAPGAKP